METEHFFYRTRMWELLTPGWIQKAAEKYHYEEKELALLMRVASDIRGCIKDQEALEIVAMEDYADIVISLGRNLDLLLDKYAKGDMVMEELMTENLVSELLMAQYKEVSSILEKDLQQYVSGLHFWGDDQVYSFEKMREVLSCFQHLQIQCTKDYCLLPSKSVVYRADLKKEPCKKQRDASICEHCSRRLRGECEQHEDRYN